MLEQVCIIKTCVQTCCWNIIETLLISSVDKTVGDSEKSKIREDILIYRLSLEMFCHRHSTDLLLNCDGESFSIAPAISARGLENEAGGIRVLWREHFRILIKDGECTRHHSERENGTLLVLAFGMGGR